MANFADLMRGFGVVTAMDMCIYPPVHGYRGRDNCCSLSVDQGPMSKDDFYCSEEFIDTMKITNINQEGPTKTITGGRYAAPIIKYGKTTTLEAQDALGSATLLERFFGAKYNGSSSIQYEKDQTYQSETVAPLKGHSNQIKVFVGKAGEGLSITLAEDGAGGTSTNGDDGIAKIVANGTDVLPTVVTYEPSDKSLIITFASPLATKDLVYVEITMKKTVTVGTTGDRITITEEFPGPFAIEGKTDFVDRNGVKQEVYIFIPQFYPNAILNLTQDSEGDAAVFDLSGTLIPTEIVENNERRTVIYEIREKSFFKPIA